MACRQVEGTGDEASDCAGPPTANSPWQRRVWEYGEMIVDTVKKFAYEIGFDIANSSSIAQAELLRGIVDGLSRIRSGHDREMQLSYIGHELPDEVAKKLREYIDTICYRGES